jgi:serine/threonine-protein kinase
VVEPLRDPLIGRVLGNYVIKRRLSEGGMGHVYVAEHEKLGHKAAVKVLKREMAEDQEWSRRFLVEAQAGAKLQSPNLVRVIDFGRMEDGYDYLMMEFLDGVSLEAYRGDRQLDVATVLTFTEQILNGLGAAHAEKIYHRDLKPANVMVLEEHTGKPLLKLIDFGLAKAGPMLMPASTGVRNNQASLMAGTPEYVSPEQAMGQVVDGRADLYSLGVMVFEMLAGALPFSGGAQTLTQMHVSTRAPSLPDDLRASLPEGLEEFLGLLLEKSPERRPPSAEAAKKTVQRLLRHVRPEDTQMRRNPLLDGPPAVAGTRPPAPSTQLVLPRAVRQSQRRRLVAAGIVIALLLAGALWVLWPRPVAVPQPAVAVPVPAAVVPPVDPPVKPGAEAPALPAVVAPVVEELPALPPPSAVSSKVPGKAPHAKQPGKVVVEAPECTPDAEWKRNALLSLADLRRMAASSPSKFAVFDEQEERISRDVAHATTASDCFQVGRALTKLQEEVQ